jgi:hypothetical protein
MDCRRSSCLVGVAVAQMPVLGVLGDERKPPRCKSRSDVGMIEIEVDGVTIRVGRGADATMIAAIVQALKGPSRTVRVMVATKPVDFRKGADGLATLVREHEPASAASIVEPCRRTCRGSRSSSTSMTRTAPAARASCTGSARTKASGWTWCRRSTGSSSPGRLREGNRAIVDDSDLEESASQALSIKAAKSGFEGFWLIQMRDNN